VGTVIIDCVDRARNRLVWQGVAEGILDPANKKISQKADKIVAKMFKNFPR
jgi:hypothetical protein